MLLLPLVSARGPAPESYSKGFGVGFLFRPVWEDKRGSKPSPEVLAVLTDSGRKRPQEPCASSEHRDTSAVDHDILRAMASLRMHSMLCAFL